MIRHVVVAEEMLPHSAPLIYPLQVNIFHVIFGTRVGTTGSYRHVRAISTVLDIRLHSQPVSVPILQS